MGYLPLELATIVLCGSPDLGGYEMTPPRFGEVGWAETLGGADRRGVTCLGQVGSFSPYTSFVSTLPGCTIVKRTLEFQSDPQVLVMLRISQLL